MIEIKIIAFLIWGAQEGLGYVETCSVKILEKERENLSETEMTETNAICNFLFFYSFFSMQMKEGRKGIESKFNWIGP